MFFLSHNKFIVNLKLILILLDIANENNIRGNRISKTATNYTWKLKFYLKYKYIQYIQNVK